MNPEVCDFRYVLTVDPKMLNHHLLSIDAANVLYCLCKSYDKKYHMDDEGLMKGNFDELKTREEFLEAI